MEEFARLPFLVYAERKAWWPPDILNEVDLLSHRSPLSPFLEIEPFVARRDGRIVARVSAVINHRYNAHWKEKLGQLIHFEAMPDEDAAASRLLDEASGWLRERAMDAARSGFAAFLDYPYAIDNYGEFPSFLLRANPAYYHRYLKDAGFETERGQIDYTAHLTPEIITRYHGMTRRGGASGRPASQLARVRLSRSGRRVDRRHQRRVPGALGMEPGDAGGGASDADLAMGNPGLRSFNACDHRSPRRRRGVLRARLE